MPGDACTGGEAFIFFAWHLIRQEGHLPGHKASSTQVVNKVLSKYCHKDLVQSLFFECSHYEAVLAGSSFHGDCQH